MRPLTEDTSPAVEAYQLSLLRTMPSWQKLALAASLNAQVRHLALRGLRRRYPQASDAALVRRFAAQRLGSALATRVYGPLPDPASPDGA